MPVGRVIAQMAQHRGTLLVVCCALECMKRSGHHYGQRWEAYCLEPEYTCQFENTVVNPFLLPLDHIRIL